MAVIIAIPKAWNVSLHQYTLSSQEISSLLRSDCTERSAFPFIGYKRLQEKSGACDQGHVHAIKAMMPDQSTTGP